MTLPPLLVTGKRQRVSTLDPSLRYLQASDSAPSAKTNLSRPYLPAVKAIHPTPKWTEWRINLPTKFADYKLYYLWNVSLCFRFHKNALGEVTMSNSMQDYWAIYNQPGANSQERVSKTCFLSVFCVDILVPFMFCKGRIFKSESWIVSATHNWFLSRHEEEEKGKQSIYDFWKTSYSKQQLMLILRKQFIEFDIILLNIELDPQNNTSHVHVD